MPFDWRTPFGYFIALAALGIGLHCISFAAVPVICFLIQSCRLLKTFVEDITKDVCRLQERSSHSSNGPREHLKREIVEYFAILIQNHSTLKQLSSLWLGDFIDFFLFARKFLHFRFVVKFNDCYEFVIIDISLWANLTICSTLLTFQFELVEYFIAIIWFVHFRADFVIFPHFMTFSCRSKSDAHLNPMVFMKTFVLIFWAFACYFLFCEVIQQFQCNSILWIFWLIFTQFSVAVWWNGHKPVHSSQWCSRSMRLVFVLG